MHSNPKYGVTPPPLPAPRDLTESRVSSNRPGLVPSKNRSNSKQAFLNPLRSSLGPTRASMTEHILRFRQCADVETDPSIVAPPSSVLLEGGHIAVLCSETTPYLALHVILRSVMNTVHAPAVVVLHPRLPTRSDWARFVPAFAERLNTRTHWWAKRRNLSEVGYETTEPALGSLQGSTTGMPGPVLRRSSTLFGRR